METLRAFFSLLTPRERRNLYFLFCAVLLMAGLEVVSVGAIMPFLKVAADPASVHENPYLSWSYEIFGFSSTNSFLIALGIGALGMLVLSNAFIVLTTWALYRYVWNRNHSLSRRLLRSYLQRPYEYFLMNNSSELGKNVLEEVKELAMTLLMPALTGGAKAVVGIAITVFLFLLDPIVASMVTLTLGTAYILLYYSVQGRLESIGEDRVEANTKRYQFVSEAFGGIKQVKLRGKENAFLEQYDEPSKWYSMTQAQSRVIKKAPRYILEAIAFGGIILIAVYLIAVRDNIQQVIPILGLYAFAGYRLMPALQQAFKGLASARFSVAALVEIREDLQGGDDEFIPHRSMNDRKEEASSDSGSLEGRLRMEDVCYTYPGADEPTIKKLSLEVPVHSTVGFVGKTGSGKTTTVDLILGLLRPQSGVISVGGTPIQSSNIRQWQREIGYVPQQIYLSDDTVARNIAFGVPAEKIDMDRVRNAARRAHISEFVERDLPEQWGTSVGEQGVKLSGGQRQRLGIARALYHDPSVLVFDEATSALDQATEKDVMEAIYDLEGNHTILMIAHRLSTVERSDKIIMLEGGEKMGEGSYEYLYRENTEFNSMASS